MPTEYVDRLTPRILFLLVLFSFQWSPVFAQNELSDAEVNQRLAYLKNSIEKDKTVNQYWWHGWLYAYSAATVGQGAVYFLSKDKSLKQDMVLGAATTLLGAAGQFISPFIPGNENAKLLLIPENSTEERMQKLAVAEAFLQACAIREQRAATWQNHILPTSVNLVGGIITWLGFKRSLWAGIGNFALNTLITETQLWTQPKLAKRRYEQYCRDYILLDQPGSPKSEVQWSLNAYPGGLVLQVVF